MALRFFVRGGTLRHSTDGISIAQNPLQFTPGNPNAEGLPEWEPYTAEKGATMIFNNDCQVKYNHDKELLEVVMAFPTRGF